METINSALSGEALISVMQKRGDAIVAQVRNAVQMQRKKLESYRDQLSAAQEVARAAAAQGDRSENAELQTAYAEISQLTIQITSYSASIEAHDRLFESENEAKLAGGSSGVCSIGSVVCISDVSTPGAPTWVIKLYPAGLGNAKIGAISMDTPLGRALSGHVAGDDVVVRAPNRDVSYHIKEVI